MDVFQLIGDFLHLVAILMLLLKIISSKTVIGLSYRTQELYMVVFLTRYSDLIIEHHWGSFYFNFMRFIFIGITATTIYYMKWRRPYKLVLLSFMYRAMMQKQILSNIIGFIQWHLDWELFFIKAQPYMVSSKPIVGGWKPQLFCLNCT